MNEMTSEARKEVLDMSDLMERWGVDRETIMAHVRNGDNPLVPFDLAPPDREYKRRTKLRFRLEDVQDFEFRMRRRAARPAEVQPVVPPGVMIGYSGKIHTGRKRKQAGKAGG